MGDDITIGVTEIVNNIEVTAQPNDQIVDISVIDNADDVTLNITPTVIEINVNKGSSYAKWGTILGTLSDQTDLQSALNLRVPYTGATSNVNLGEYGLTGGFLALDITPTSTPTGIGTIYWDSANRTAALIDGDGDTTLQIGQEQRILVHNNTGSTLTDGQVVYVTGSTGNLPSVSLANASSETTSAATIGVVTESIAQGADGFITTSGIVNGLNTLSFNEGDLLWLGTTAGTFTATKPISPNHLVLIGYVIKKAGGNGSILVKIQNTQELEESSDVLFTSLANNQVLTYESATDLWKNKSIATILGYTPANDASVVKLAGAQQTISGVKVFSANVIFSGPAVFFDSDSGLKVKQTGLSSYNQISAIDGGFNFTADSGTAFYFNIQPSTITFGLENKKVTFNNSNLTSNRTYDLPNASGTLALTSQLHNAVTLGTANGLSLSTQVLSLGLASGSANGALSSTDWTTFNNKQNALTNPVTGIGTTNYLPKFTGASAIGNSLIYDNGTNVGIGTTTDAGYKLDVNGTGRFSGNLQIEGSSYPAIKINGGSTGGGGVQFLSSGNVYGEVYGEYESANNGTLIFRTRIAGDVATRMRINGNGTVNISASISGNSLTVNGTANDWATVINGNTTTSQAYGLKVKAGTNSTDNSFLVSNTSDSQLFRVRGDGNVGIGNVNPSQLLHLYKPATGSGDVLLALQKGTNIGYVFCDGTNIGLASDQGGTGYKFLVNRNAPDNAMSITSNGELLIGRTSSYGAGWQLAVEGNIYAKNDLRIDANASFGGNVGIGTASPSTQLQVVGSSFSLLRVSAAADNVAGIDFGTVASPDISRIRYNNSTNSMSIRVNSIDAVNITSGGNVYVNATSGLYSAFGYAFGVKAASGNQTYLSIATPSQTLDSEGLVIGVNADDASIILRDNKPLDFWTNNTNRMRITSGGNVGIGTTSPSYKLDVNGTGRFTASANTYAGGSLILSSFTGGTNIFLTSVSGVFALSNGGSSDHLTIASTGAATFSSTVTATAFIPTSDIRLKDLTDYNYNVESIKPITYTWKDSEDKRKKIGYSAQQVQVVLPEVVNTDEKGMLSVDYNQIFVAKIDMLQNMIQELKQEIEILKNK